MMVIIFVLSILYTYTLQIPVHEGIGGFKAIVRAIQMIRKRFWFAVGSNLLTSMIVGFVIGTVSGFFVLLIFIPYGFIFTAIVMAIFASVTAPILIVVNSLLYYDLKMLEDYLAGKETVSVPL
jgi:hypothetical protein